MSEVCVHGLGYVGLPAATMMANYGHRVYGYDADPEVRSLLRAGDVHLEEPGLRAFVTQGLESGQLEVVDEVRPADYHVVCVPTPFDEASRTADLGYVESVGRAVADHLRVQDTVVLESTVPPGTTEEVLAPILEESGLAVGEEVALAHCPETVLPGDIIAELRNNDRIVGGVDSYSSLAADYGVDSRDAIALANGHPRVDILQPGPGVGGHCLPVDPWFLGHDSEELDLIETARRVNDGMSEFIIGILVEELGSLADRKIAILGAAYKGNVGDTRSSPGLKLARELQYADEKPTPVTADGGAIDPPTVSVHDPHVTDPTLNLDDLEAATTDADAVVVTTDHDEFERLNPATLRERMCGSTVVDTKAILRPEAWRRAGFDLRRV
jgi:UDP-N-acetyl-D-mannosaminuronic acid dehydrogenase